MSAPATSEPAATKTLSVVVPVYGNEGSLPALFEALLAVEQGLGERGMRLGPGLLSGRHIDQAELFPSSRGQGGPLVGALRRRAPVAQSTSSTTVSGLRLTSS